MRITSVRLKLMLSNIGILALVLFVFLAIVQISVRSYLLSSMDKRLKQMGDRTALFIEYSSKLPTQKMPPPPPPPPPNPELMRRFGGGRYERMVRAFDIKGRLLGPFGMLAEKQEPPLDMTGFQAGMSGRSVFIMTRKGEDAPSRVYYRPMTANGRRTGVIQVAMSFADVQVLLNNLTLTLIALIPVALIIAGLGGLLLTSRALHPVQQIVKAANDLHTDDLSQRLPVVGADEFAHLATTVNSLLSRLEDAFTQLKRAIELERRFTADASHELRTPLTAIKANTSLALRSERSVDEYKKAILEVNQSADTMNRLVQDLLLLARSDASQLALSFDSVDPHDLLEDAVGSVRVEEIHTPVTVRVPESAGAIYGDREHLRRLVMNLLENALRHTPSDGKVVLEAANEGENVIISVSDTGEGIAPEHLLHLGERFYRVDAARTRNSGGSGLGLAICKSIVEAHGGAMNIDSALGQGTRVKVTLKQAQPDPDIYA